MRIQRGKTEAIEIKRVHWGGRKGDNTERKGRGHSDQEATEGGRIGDNTERKDKEV